MNANRVLPLLAAFFLSSGAAFAQYSIDWWSIDGGGGTSTGGVYTISGSIGQSDAGTLQGGPYTLTGGFWSIVAAIQTPGAPTLSIQVTNTTQILISWPSPAEGFALEETPNVEGGAWTPVSTTPLQVGNRWELVLTPPAGNRFYRLKK